ncbi:transporter substrate-binding domain-containing protein [Chitinilyticum piscinae]|uniref:Transporter substrate-binding domain-containing protein n=1 Tax=Chitinilyticum piscinae TaxID=2866724 RepID=A0A8J7FZ24_9NEIS|nr:transporter substrate-binding domain-containing protein [Chitinilyticum piscinae]MBE9608318.1 transporter substrate-binding domain-containing protein [Chitinilyticum piscinae]
MKAWLIAAALLLAQNTPATTLAELQSKGEIRIGVKENSPPFSQMDPKTRVLRGYDIEFAQGVAKRLKVKPVFIPIDSEERLNTLKQNKVDLVVADLTRTIERDKEVDFSVGYFVTEDRILAKKGRFRSEAALNGATLGVLASSSTAKVLRKDFPAARLVQFEDNPDISKALQGGMIDGAAGDGPVLAALRNSLPANLRSQFEVSEFSLGMNIFAIGLRKGEKDLQKAVNEALADMEKTGEASAIFERWFGLNSATPLLGRTFSISTRRVE